MGRVKQSGNVKIQVTLCRRTYDRVRMFAALCGMSESRAAAVFLDSFLVGISDDALAACDSGESGGKVQRERVNDLTDGHHNRRKPHGN